MYAINLYPGLTMAGVIGSVGLLNVQISFNAINAFQDPGTRIPFRPIGGEVGKSLSRFAELMFGNIPFTCDTALEEAERIMRLAVDSLKSPNIGRSQTAMVNGWNTQFYSFPHSLWQDQRYLVLRAWCRTKGEHDRDIMSALDPMLRGVRALFKQIISEESD
ncbi:MAG: hypothetical protein ABH871_04095 [Pseudomonadota bacterium]